MQNNDTTSESIIGYITAPPSQFVALDCMGRLEVRQVVAFAIVRDEDGIDLEPVTLDGAGGSVVHRRGVLANFCSPAPEIPDWIELAFERRRDPTRRPWTARASLDVDRDLAAE